MGARATKDGKDGVQVNITNTSNLPIEAIETEYPLRVEAYALVEDTGGAGEFRGGMGLRRSIRPIGHSCELSSVGERFRHQPWGIFGGLPGQAGQFRLESDNGEVTSLPSKASGVRLNPDQTAVIETPGAGGYGQPQNRAPTRLDEDHASGKFSSKFIEDNYKNRK